MTALVVSGIALIVIGTQKWLEKREVVGVVNFLMTALKKGDRQAIHSLLPPQHPELANRFQGGSESRYMVTRSESDLQNS